MASPKRPHDSEDLTEELTSYVTPAVKADVLAAARAKGVSVSVVVRWALIHWLKEQRR